MIKESERNSEEQIIKNPIYYKQNRPIPAARQNITDNTVFSLSVSLSFANITGICIP